MMNFQMVQRVKILSGIDSILKLPELLKIACYKKPLFVYDKGTFDAGIIDTALAPIKENNIEFEVFDETIPDPPIFLIEKGVEVCKKAGCDSVIGIGGGSSIDTAKAINVIRCNGGDIMRFSNPEEVMKYSPGFIAIPTTAGTGSELSDGIILTNTETNQKLAILCTAGIAEYALVDPKLMVTMPAALTASTGIDSLAHTFEAYTSILSDDFTDMILEKNAETIIKWLPIAVKEPRNLEARTKMAVASSIGGWMLACAHVHSGHSIAHILGGKYHIPHGVACAYTLPYVIAYITESSPEKIKNILQMFGKTNIAEIPKEKLGNEVKECIKTFIDNLGIKVVSPSQEKFSFDDIAKDIEDELFQMFSPKKMYAADARSILKEIFGK